MYIKFPSIMIALAAGSVLCSCSKGSAADAMAAIEKNDTIPAAVKALVRSVADNDSVRFANLVSYPLERPYPLRDISDASEMRAYYKVMVDDSLRHILTSAHPNRWSESGWRGWTLDDGRYIWADENIYDVQYLSHAEREKLDSLANQEILSLDPHLREGWRPELCLRDDASGRIYRLDVKTEGEPSPGHNIIRLAVYDKETPLGGMPSEVLTGIKEENGSEGNISYSFATASPMPVVIEPSSSDTGEPLLYNGNDEGTQLSRIYWRDLIPKK